MWTPDKPSRFNSPPPDPKKPWALNANDRWFLKGLKIDPESDKTPYPQKENDDAGD